MASKKYFLAAGILFGTLVTPLIVLSYYVNQLSKVQEVLPNSNAAFSDFFAAQEMHQKILLENHQSYVTKDGNKNGYYEGHLKGIGKIQRGYLLVEVSVDGGKPLTAYDSMYLLWVWNGKEIGGHLMRPKSLPVLQNSGNKTVLLYALNDISYLKNQPYMESRTAEVADFQKWLNENQPIVFHTFLSSQRPGGKIEKIAIAYDCEDQKNCEVAAW